MNKICSLLLLVFVIACSKIDMEQFQDPKAKTAAFVLSKEQAYINEPVIISPLDSGGLARNYKYDFGDGKKASNQYTTQHTFSKSGTFKISLKVDEQSFDKSITIYPGYLSYQIRNVSSQALDLLFYLDNIHSGTLRRDSLAANEISDTLFVASGPLQDSYHFYASLFFKNKEYLIVPSIENDLFPKHAHNMFTISDSTTVMLRNAGDSVLYLTDLK